MENIKLIKESTLLSNLKQGDKFKIKYDAIGVSYGFPEKNKIFRI